MDTTLIPLNARDTLRLIFKKADLEISVAGKSLRTLHLKEKVVPFLRGNNYQDTAYLEWELGKPDPWRYKLIFRKMQGDTTYQGLQFYDLQMEMLVGKSPN